MIRFVNAKINLGLNIVERRADGYHNLETVFYPVGGRDSGFCDILEIIPSDDGKDELITIGNTIDCPKEKNLVWKALTAFRSHCNKLPGLKIILEKHLPDGAGMGGGSADAAFALKMLNELAENPLSENELLLIAAKIGADCPFFILNRPCIAKGIGEILSPINLTLSDYWIVIAKPDESISTKEAFSMILPQYPPIHIEEVISSSLKNWHDKMTNDFEIPMFTKHPNIKNIKEQLYSNGAIYASMTGSGSAFYGLFDSQSSAEKCISQLNTPFTFMLRGT